MNNTERLPYYDFLRGIATLFVVAIHMFSCFYTTAKDLSLYALILYNIVSCAVPIFCASSGFFLINKNLEGDEYKKFILKQGLRVYLPMLFFSLPYFMLSLINGGDIPKNVIKLLFGAYSVYYFPITILQFYLLLPFFQKHKGVRNVIIGCIVTFTYFCIWYFFVRRRVNLPTVLIAGPIPFYFCYFVIGAKYGKNELNLGKTPLSLICFVCVVIIVINSVYNFYASLNNHEINLGGPVIIFFFAFIVLFLYSAIIASQYKNNFFNRIFVRLGRYSFGIYLTHLYVLQIIEKIINYYTFAPPSTKFLLHLLENKSAISILLCGQLRCPYLLAWIFTTVIITGISYLGLWCAKKLCQKLIVCCLVYKIIRRK